ncbi:MAG TPA: zf-HC2 domain-containing protein [Lachnospiraceae bacterium]|nr:zf-HC2 domain-containing protein [Lachnospiraceae bacterium]
MKIDCDIIRDLLPLYSEGMVSTKSTEMIEEHFTECEACQKQYQKMMIPAPVVTFDTAPAKNFKKYVTKKKRRFGWKIALITAAAIISITALYFLIFGGAIGLLILSSVTADVEMDTDVSHYSQYIGEYARDEYINKWEMDESIFPQSITDRMNVKDYKMVYYNPWDAQYLSYLSVTYEETDYTAEVNRLQSYPSSDYLGYYGVTGFEDDYELLAIYADSYNGFVYALTDGFSEIIYVEIIFCNYYMDLDYTDYINPKYLPVGFDATADNPYCLEKREEL